MENIKILIIGGDKKHYHEFSIIGPLFSRILSGNGFDVTLTDDFNYFLPENIMPYKVILCFSLKPYLNARQAEGLLEAVIGNPWGRTGVPKGYLGVHGASASFINNRDYLKMLGGKFLTHPPMGGPYRIHVKNPEHPVLKGITDFEINDELYLMDTYPPFETLLETEYLGFSRPLAWVKPYGLGRVCYLALGHGPDQMRNPFFGKFITNALLWCANIK